MKHLKSRALLLKVLFAFVIVFFLTFNFIHKYNEIKQKQVSFYIRNKVYQVYDQLHSFTQHYVNTKSVFMENGIHHINHVGVFNPSSQEIKYFSSKIKKLSLNLKGLVNDDYWTLAVIENAEKDILYSSPLRTSHIKDLDDSDGHLLKKLINDNNIPRNYDDFFKSTNLGISHSKKEKFSHEKIRSIFMPIYLENLLSALIVFDVKNTIYTSWVSDFNREQLTLMSTEAPDFGFQLPSLHLLTTTKPEEIKLYIDYKKLTLISGLLSLVMTFLMFVIFKFFITMIDLIQIDNMTKCYRRDYGEKKYKNKILIDKTILIFDIDHFKNINDTYGHDVGDQVISQTAAIIKSNIRSTEQLYRWGGEEFVLILGIGDQVIAERKANQLREAIADQKNIDVDFTISIGGTIAKNMKLEDSIKIADRALYNAKNSGRNKVIFQ